MPKPPEPSGTLSINPASDLHLGGHIQFDYTVGGKLPGNTLPRIQLLSYQDTDGDGQIDDIVCGVAGNAEPGTSYDAQPWVLGGGSSQWLTNGGPATCVASLYYWGQVKGIQTWVRLSEDLTFIAEG
jgi:hypothetical protein